MKPHSFDLGVCARSLRAAVDGPAGAAAHLASLSTHCTAAAIRHVRTQLFLRGKDPAPRAYNADSAQNPSLRGLVRQRELAGVVHLFLALDRFGEYGLVAAKTFVIKKRTRSTKGAVVDSERFDHCRSTIPKTSVDIRYSPGPIGNSSDADIESAAVAKKPGVGASRARWHPTNRRWCKSSARLAFLALSTVAS
jgi:hypothetical protein